MPASCTFSGSVDPDSTLYLPDGLTSINLPTMATSDLSSPPVVLFGYEASTFTLKVRLVLKLKQIPYTFITVPSMLPRPLLTENFNLTYRKIPVLAIGREIYCDTSLIVEALEHFFPEAEGYQTLYPAAADGRNYRPMIRGFASYWTDRPLFRVTTGLIPAQVRTLVLIALPRQARSDSMRRVQ